MIGKYKVGLKMRAQLLAAAAAIALSTPAVGEVPEGRAWVDVSLDDRGQVLEAVVVNDMPQSVAEPIKAWVEIKTFEPARTNGEPVPSTTSVWVRFALEETEAGFALRFLGYGGGPRPIKRLAPHYPYSEAKAGRQGWVKVSFTVEPSGHVNDANVVESSHKVFEKSALESVEKWRFKPRTVNGKAIATPVIQTIEFRLEEGAS